MDKYILSLDQGTSSSRAILFDHDCNIVSVAQQEFTQYFPKPGWVEHNPEEIWSSEFSCITKVLSSNNINSENIAALGLSNQRETTIIWDAVTGEPVYNAIVWQDRRTSEFCDELKAKGLTERIHEKTGLLIDAYFSGTKIRWILDNVPSARERAQRGELRFGTVDTWLVWKLTRGRVHVTDVTNASRTMLFNINTLEWDKELLELLDIPQSLMPQVRSCSEVFGETDLFGKPIKISGIAGDQQAALFGHVCFNPGDVKNTYGTGCFMLMNTGEKPVMSKNNLLTTIACQINGKTTYALEGSVFVAGSLVQWLRDSLGIIKYSEQIESLATSVPDNGGVYFVPALTGLGAPYWDQYARGTIVGLTRGSSSAHIARAAEEGICYQVMDVLNAMERDSGVRLSSLKVDGGATRDNFLLQFQSDLLRTTVLRPVITDTTALGAALLAGLAVGFWPDMDSLSEYWRFDRVFAPCASKESVDALIKGWNDAIQRTLTR